VSSIVRATALAAVLGAAIVAAGCGGGGTTPTVASLGPTTKSATTTTAGSTVTSKSAGAFAFSRCMRAHGLPNFPDPGSNGDLTITPAIVNPGSSTFQHAQQACQKELPVGQAPSPAQFAQMKSQLLKFSACMRSHGVPDFPDPQFSTSGATVRVGISVNGGGPSLDPASPVFQHAQTSCQQYLPGKGRGILKVGVRTSGSVAIAK